MATLCRLLYHSVPSPGVNQTTVNEIVEAACQNNDAKALTGFLVFRHDMFMQVVEGDRKRITNLLKKLLNDSRHEHLEVVHMGAIEERLFADWGMSSICLSTKEDGVLRRFAAQGILDPRSLRYETALSMLCTLADSVREPALQTK